MGNQCCGDVTGQVVGKEGVSDPVTSEELVRALSGGENVGKRRISINVKAIQTVLYSPEDDEEEDEGEAAPPPRKGPRKVTGYITKADLDSAVERMTEEEEEAEAEAKPRDQRIKARKGTGVVSKEKLLSLLMDDSDEEGEGTASEKALEKGKASPAVTEGTAQQRCKNRKGTGFVTKDKLKKVLAAVGEGEDLSE